jgi:ribosomal protein L39E
MSIHDANGKIVTHVSNNKVRAVLASSSVTPTRQELEQEREALHAERVRLQGQLSEVGIKAQKKENAKYYRENRGVVAWLHRKDQMEQEHSRIVAKMAEVESQQRTVLSKIRHLAKVTREGQRRHWTPTQAGTDRRIAKLADRISSLENKFAAMEIKLAAALKLNE